MHRAQSLLGEGCLGCAGQPGDPKIRDLYAAVPEHQDVLGLDIPVDDPPAVGVAQGPEDLGDEMDGLPPVQRGAPLLHVLLQGHAVNELHDDIVQPVGMAHIVDGHNVHVGEHGHRLGLIVETAAEIRVVGQLGLQNLHRHQTVEPVIPALVHHGHAAHADALHQLIPVIQQFPYVLIHRSCSSSFTAVPSRWSHYPGPQAPAPGPASAGSTPPRCPGGRPPAAAGR